MKKNKSHNTLWTDEIFPQYQTIYDKENESWIDHLLINIYADSQRKLDDNKIEYKKHHNQFYYYFFYCVILPLSILLIIPAYWSIKKIKELKSNKNNLLAKIEEAKIEKLKIHQNIISQLDVVKIIESFKDIIKYQHQGPIPLKLVEEMQALSIFDLSTYSDSINPYSTSWGIFDDKIVIHASKQSHNTFNKKYTGSTIVSYYSTDSEGRPTTRTATVFATYTHPAYSIDSERYSYAFMESCSNLEFWYDGKKSLLSKKYNKKYNYSSLENKEFEKRFNWYRNDDVQFRMIFTPYTQEKFLDELGDNKEPTPELSWSKSLSFIHNDYPTIQFNYIIERNIASSINQFLSDSESNLEELKLSIFSSITNYYFNLYKNMNYMFLTTIMPSENHKTIINAINKSNNWISNKNNYFFAHNILSEFLSKNIIKKDTNCFNKLKNSSNSKVNGVDVYQTQMDGLSYSIVEKTKYIPTYCFEAGRTVSVPVNYDHYIPHNAQGYIVYFFIPTNFYYYQLNDFGIRTNMNNELLTNIDQLNAQKVILKNNIFALYTDQEFVNYELLGTIIKLLKQKNHNS